MRDAKMSFDAQAGDGPSPDSTCNRPHGQAHDAVLLLAHGTPDVLGEMADYLRKVTGGRDLPFEVVQELQHRYGQIGLRSRPVSRRRR